MKFKYNDPVQFVAAHGGVVEGVFLSPSPVKPNDSIILIGNRPAIIETKRLKAPPTKTKRWAVLWRNNAIYTFTSDPRESHEHLLKDGKIVGVKEFEVSVSKGEGLDG